MIDFIHQIHFIRPAWLGLLPVVVLVWWLWRRQMDPLRGWRHQIDAELLKALTVGGEARQKVQPTLLLVAWLIGVLAIAGPSWKLEPNPLNDGASPLVVLLKADTSMDTPDPSPSRLVRAQLKLADLAELRPGKALGLTAYAGSAHLVLPPTTDTAVVAQMGAELSSAIMPVQGDRLDLALLKAKESLSDQDGRLLVITDRIDTDPVAVKAAYHEIGKPALHVLIINRQDSPETTAIRRLAKDLGATTHLLTADDSDLKAIVRASARAPRSASSDKNAIWHEAGYWLTPLLALLFLPQFRRQSNSHSQSK